MNWLVVKADCISTIPTRIQTERKLHNYVRSDSKLKYCMQQPMQNWIEEVCGLSSSVAFVCKIIKTGMNWHGDLIVVWAFKTFSARSRASAINADCMTDASSPTFLAK